MVRTDGSNEVLQIEDERFDMSCKSIAQFGDTLLTYEHVSKPMQIMKYTRPTNKAKMQIKELKSFDRQLEGFPATPMFNSIVVVTGGYDRDRGEDTAETHMHKVAKDEWHELPPLNVAR